MHSEYFILGGCGWLYSLV